MSNQREAIAETIHEAVEYGELPRWYSMVGKGTKYERTAQADAVIAHLWQRADDPEVVEAVAKATWDSSPENARWDDVRKHRAWDIATDPMLSDAKASITALLTSLLGPRPSGEEAADER